VFNATFNNISVLSWRSALLVEETGSIKASEKKPLLCGKKYNLLKWYKIHDK
jgi:hypothetical protein